MNKLALDDVELKAQAVVMRMDYDMPMGAIFRCAPRRPRRFHVGAY